MIAPVKKIGRARLSTDLLKTNLRDLREREANVKFCKRRGHLTFKHLRKVPVALHLNLGHLEASGINIPK